MIGATHFVDFVAGALAAQEINFFNATLRLFLAMILGGAVGWERKRKGQAAGVRTFALISMGACMAMLISIYVPQEFLGLKNGDPGRIAAQVVTGVGFLGGGAMIQQRGSIRGLTTAAGIWMVATIGMAIGVGMYLESALATVLILLVLTCFEYWEKRHRIGHDTKVINMKVEGVDPDISAFRRALQDMGVVLTTYYLNCDYETDRSTINFIVLLDRDSDIPAIFSRLRSVQPALGISLATQVDDNA